MADNDSGRANCLHAGVHRTDVGLPKRRRPADHVGDQQEPCRFGKGVRPNDRLHPGHGGGAQGAGQQHYPQRRAADLPDSAVNATQIKVYKYTLHLLIGEDNWDMGCEFLAC